MWMIYGANGYTGELIAREAVHHGEQPVLAGRNRDATERLALELGLEPRVFGLDDPTRVARSIAGMDAVLHCAGPFVETSRPMVDACLASGVHYLDITGEIAVFEAIFARDDEAKARNVTLLPGVGFDVVPTDCLAAMLHQRMRDATHLDLAYSMRGGAISRGTLSTVIEGLGSGGAIREAGRIRRVAMVHDVREIPFSIGTRTAMTIPWGDVATAYRTTGIPNIRVYSASSPKAIARARRVAKLEPLLASRPVKNVLRWIVRRRVTGPDERTRTTAKIFLWGSARNAHGAEVTQTMTVPEGYRFTAMSAVLAIQTLLSQPRRGGATTPAARFGSGFVAGIPGVVID